MRRMVFAVIAIALLIAAGFAAWSAQRFRIEALRAEGVVTRLNAGGSHPQIRFTTAAGDTVEYAQGGLIFGYRPGDRVMILYRAERSQATANLDRPGTIWAATLLLGVIGLGFALDGLLDFMASRRG